VGNAENSKDNQLTVLSCTKHKGLVDSLSYFGKRIFSENLSTYKIVKRGQFAYATNHIEEGSIGYQNLYDEALISPMYTVFESNKKVNDSFLYKILKTETYRLIFEAMTSGSINRRGSLRWNGFKLIKIKLPSLEEQKRIAEVLETCDAEISLHQKELASLKEQKRGLMQQLLTGKVRVKVEGE
jgi:type I restriction enzyme, S subunit